MSNTAIQKITLKDVFKVDFAIVVIVSFLTMFPSYYFSGAKGVEGIVDTLVNQTKIEGVIFLLVVGILSFVFMAFYYFFNLENKFFWSNLSQGLMDVWISFCRFTAGTLLTFSILYWRLEEFEHFLIVYWVVAAVFLVYSTALSYGKLVGFSRKNRDMQKPSAR